ncbi:MAG: hypothetical protein GX030_10900 [Firmicutes bacterium]|nr:hypothetical protein [Bacillota bacterium]
MGFCSHCSVCQLSLIFLVIMGVAGSFVAFANEDTALHLPEIILIADAGNHWVFGCTLQGTLVWSAGERGQLGEISEGLLSQPLFVQHCQDDRVVVADASQGLIVEYTPLQVARVTRVLPEDQGRGQLPVIRSAFKLDSGNYLYADGGQHWVAEIASQGGTAPALADGQGGISTPGDRLQVIWSFGQRDFPGRQTLLYGPTWAQPLANGNILIADSLNGRVLETDRQGNIVRQHGAEGLTESEVILIEPVCVEWLATGEYLVCDPGQGQVLEIDGSGKIVWKLDTVTVADERMPLQRPVHATRLGSELTLITDAALEDVLLVDRKGKVLWSYEAVAAVSDSLKPLAAPAMAIPVF